MLQFPNLLLALYLESVDSSLRMYNHSKPSFSHIHLDEIGSFVWPLIDGQINIVTLGVMVEEQFGEKAAPLYPRLAKFFQVLDSYRFVEWK